MIKTVQNVGIEKLPQHNKGHIWQTHNIHYSQWWKTESISSKIRKKTKVPTLATIIHRSFEVLAMQIWEETEIKGIQTSNEVVKVSLLQITWYYTY